MTTSINIKKGLNISMKGQAVPEILPASVANEYALTPSNFHGMTPKVVVREGDQVLAGSPLIIDKNIPTINFVSPVSGSVKAVVRGEKRKLLHVVVEADGRNESLSFPVRNPLEMSAEELKVALQTAGLWPFVKQRPYDLVARPNQQPKAIFVSGMDTHPLAPDYAFLLKGQGHDLQTGLNAMTRLTEGKVHLCISADSNCAELNAAQGVEIHRVSGPHPAGNLSVQINRIDPINKGEVVWTINALDLLFIGRLFNKGVVDLTQLVAVTGPEVYQPAYYRVKAGVSMQALLRGNVYKEIPLRYISGNALTGTAVDKDAFLGFYDHQVTVLHDGFDTFEFMGWMMPRFNLFSMSKLYCSKLMQLICPKKEFSFDTRILGGERAFIMSGEIEKVFPMDIMPEQLLKAMISKNLEKMEALGAYEVVPEDFALCEYVCTSKIPMQKIAREALEYMRKELE